MKRLALALMAGLILNGCANAVLLSDADRKAEYVENTDASKQEAYSQALIYLAKTLGNSNYAIKNKDEAGARIVSQAAVECLVFRQALDPNPYRLQFTFDFEAKDKRVKLSFEDMMIVDKLGRPFDYSYNQLTSKEQVEKSKECLAGFKQGLMRSIASVKSNSNW